MDYAYSLLETKDFDDESETVTVKGVATTPTPDRMQDIVNPMGAQFKAPMPLLWMHNHEKPVGHMMFAKPTKTGIPFEASIPKVKEAGTLKDRIDEAIHSLKYKLIMAVSIGFRPIDGDYEVMENGGIKYNTWEWLELSLVTIPANAEAKINLVKTIDRETLAALGNRETINKHSPGASGLRKPIQIIPRRHKT